MKDYIKHGIPKHKYFCIVQPFKNESYNDRVYADPKLVYNFEDPKSGDRFQARLHNIWRFDFDDLPDAFSRLTYGISAKKLSNLLLTKYPELQQSRRVEYQLFELV